MKICKNHPKYKGINPPLSIKCDECYKLFMEKHKVKAPIDVKTYSQVLALPQSVKETKNAWILVENKEIHLYKQKVGEKSTENITLNKNDFDKLVRWYVFGKENVQ